MATARNIDARRVTLGVSAPLLESDGEKSRPPVMVYAYSTGGTLLGQAMADEKGQAQLDVMVGQGASGVRLMAGPAGEDKMPRIDTLLRRGAQERHLRIEPGIDQLRVDLALTPDIWRTWLVPALCLVKGTLNKRIERDGISVDMPVCHATVEIYEVDPIHILIPKIPKYVLERLREVIVGPIPRPDPWLDIRGDLVSLNPQPLPPEPGPDPMPVPPMFARTMMARATQTASAELPAQARMAMQDASASTSLRLAAASGSDVALRQALIDNAVLIRPLLCWLHPQLVNMQLIATTTTDECGHFRTHIFKGFFNPDQPDLYFKAKQRLFGFFDVTIYAPTPVACHTWWNYVCGTEVNLHTSHPLARTCRPCPPINAGENWVLFMAVGNHPLSRIHGTAAALGVPTAANRGLTDTGAPWGGTLRPRLEFDNSLRDVLGVKYYRLSWKRDGEAATDFKHMTGDVGRHYAHMLNGELVDDAYPLGPNTVGTQGNLFEIPPGIPPLGQWSFPDLVTEHQSGVFDTVQADGTPLLDGKVQIRVELFDTGGNPVDINALGIRYFVPTSTDLTGTVDTADAATLGLVVGNTMVITLHVNNRPCTASIAPPSINAATADPCCGVLNYALGDTVQMNWTASHPQGFATYSFGVVRGVNSVFSASGPVGGGSFGVSRSVAQLLNDNLPAGCAPGGCPVAGFSENLYVAAMATDGWSRQSQYDRPDVRAFVLAAS